MVTFSPSALRASTKRRYLQRMYALEMEGFRLYRPLPLAEQFHSCKAKIRIARGSNRASKTLSCLIEFIRAMCNVDPYDKYPAIGDALMVAEDADNIADIWAKMTREGEIKLIRDERTRKWRAVRYSKDHPKQLDPYDASHKEQWRDGPPLLPARSYYKPAWEDYGKGVPRVVRFKSGWRCLFRSSNGSPQKGAHYNFVWFDEQLLNDEFFVEARRGLVATNELPQHIPRFVWSATSQVTNPQLQDLAEAAHSGARHVNDFKFLIVDNPYIPEDEKEAFYRDIPLEQRISRWEGDFALNAKRVYASYQPMGVHSCEAFPVPPNWARYFVVDPGTENCATMFVAVPPDESHMYVYDGFVIQQSNLTKWASEVVRVANRNAGYAFEAAVCDNRAGLQHQMGLNVSSTAEEYWKALIEAGVNVRTMGSVKHMGGFFPGSSNVEAREQNLLQLMDIRGTGQFAGTAKLQVMRGVIPDLDYQLKRAHIDPKTGKRAGKNKVGAHDILDCYDEETEVLTEVGWKLFKDVSKGERVATVNLETDCIEYQQPTNYIQNHHDGELIYFGGHKLDIAVTPGHRMVSYRLHTWKKDGNGEELQIVRAEDLVKDRDRLKLHANWNGCIDLPISIEHVFNGKHKDVSIDRGLFAEFLGWYIAEGCIDSVPKCPGNGYRINISQTKPHTKKKIKELLSKTPWTWTEHSLGFSSSSRQLWTYLEPLGNVYTKYVPQWVKDSPKHIIDRFLHGAVSGDGYVTKTGQRHYYTVNKRLADDIQELFIKSGTAAAVRKKQQRQSVIRGKKVNSRDHIYWVMEWTHRVAGLSRHDRTPNYTRKPYRGYVYCLTVPNGTLIVRRNGCPVIAGNCLEYIAAHDPGYAVPTRVFAGKQVDPSESDPVADYRRKHRSGSGNRSHMELS